MVKCLLHVDEISRIWDLSDGIFELGVLKFILFMRSVIATAFI